MRRVNYLVFARAELDLAAVATNADRFFACKVERMEAGTARATLGGGQQATFAALSRKATRDDVHAAREAEARGAAAGMGAVVDLCAWVWEVTFEPSSSPPALFTALAALASVALGPVLPPDHSTLFAVRGARARADGNT
jgi:hypothetical protein